MSYTYNKPDATDTISSSQSVIKDNFTAIKSLIDVNHVTFGDPSEGKHSIVHFPNLTVTPGSIPAATSATEYALYSTSSGLFLRLPSQTAGTVTLDRNITGGLKANPGWCIWPNGIIVKWGYGNITAGSSGASGTATDLVYGAGIPTITTLLTASATLVGTSKLSVGYGGSFDESAHTVTAYGWSLDSSSHSGLFYYMLLGV